MKKVKGDDLISMVNWYDPCQLRDTATKTIISTVIGENADPRTVAAAATLGKYFDYSYQLEIDDEYEFKPKEKEVRREIFIDYTADVGDGWNSTYSVAHCLARTQLKVAGDENISLDHPSIPRGEILIFGGDEVYPTATDLAYKKKFIAPYQMAFNTVGRRENWTDDKTNLKEHPHVFALPGNHDWYDSLVAFQKIFCTGIVNRRMFAGGWRTRQKRSYFALKLPHKWWLLAVDFQLSHNIDVRQLEYFQSIIHEMEPGSKIILCVPEPYWVKAIKYRKYPEVFKEKEESIKLLEDLLSAREVEVKLYLAGDLHHYRRFESVDDRKVQKITAGGGGAFLHPTHDFDFDKHFNHQDTPAGNNFKLKCEYPDRKESRKLGRQNLYGFIWKNKTFGILPGILYPLLALLVHANLQCGFTFVKALLATLNQLFVNPAALIIVILAILGLIFFTDSKSVNYRVIAGGIHGLSHLTAAFACGWLGFVISRALTLYYKLDEVAEHAVWFGCIVLTGTIGGYLLGSVIMGVYLFISLQWFGRHDNEAFSALKIEDYKNFLRLHIKDDGSLTIYPFMIEKVERNWKPVKNKSGEITGYEPRPDFDPKLIEKIDPIN